MEAATFNMATSKCKRMDPDKEMEDCDSRPSSGHQVYHQVQVYTFLISYQKLFDNLFFFYRILGKVKTISGPGRIASKFLQWPAETDEKIVRGASSSSTYYSACGIDFDEARVKSPSVGRVKVPAHSGHVGNQRDDRQPRNLLKL